MLTTAEWTRIRPGIKKFVHIWTPDAAPTANVAIVHGLGEHGGRYHRLAQSFVESGFCVTAFDQQGHGRSSEVRGQIASYDSMLTDIESFLDWNRVKFAGIPQVLFGHSMGGNLVINYALRTFVQPHRVIASSPMIEQVRPPSAGFVRLARIALWLAPNLKLRSKVVPERLMNDPTEQELLRSDELFHSQVTLRLGGALLDTGAWALNNAERLKTPMLLSHGTADTMTSPIASAEFARRAGDACRLEILEGFFHDPFRDLARQKAIDMYVAFIGESVGR